MLLSFNRNQKVVLGLIATILVVSESMSLSKYSLKQAINIPGLTKAMQAIFKPSLLIPQISVKSINDLNFQDMKNNGINCVVFDKDNTLR